MVKKLFHHEWIAIRRFMVPLSIGFLALALLGRLSFLVDPARAGGGVHLTLVAFQVVSMLLYGSGLFALFIISFVMLVNRFNHHLLSREGYLSFSLPVTRGQHLLVKFVSAGATMLWNLLLVVLSLLVLGAGTGVLHDVFAAIGSMMGAAAKLVGVPNLVFFLLELLLGLVVSTFVSFLFIDTCICVGQLMSRHRTLGALLCFGAGCVITQVVTTVLGVLLLNGSFSFVLDRLLTVRSLLFGSHALLLSLVAIEAAVGCGLFFLSRFVLTRKLNLE